MKPANILYTTKPDGQYLFQLGDFGLCNRELEARSVSGSEAYMAPEIYQERRPQLCKADVWSLFVTMMWVLDVGGFRRNIWVMQSRRQILESVLRSARRETFATSIREMAIEDPRRRASAAQMLMKNFDGWGLTTPRDQILPLDSIPSAPIATASTTNRRLAMPSVPTGLGEAMARNPGNRRKNNGQPLLAPRHSFGTGRIAKNRPERLRGSRARFFY